MTEKDQLIRDGVFFATAILGMMKTIRENDLVSVFAGDDLNAFNYIEDEAKKMLEEYQDE